MPKNSKASQENKNINNQSVPESSSNVDFMKTVLDSMDCPICLEFLQPPIYMCITGHHICDKCRQKLSIEMCPVCKADITNQRNYGLEAIATKVISVCPNKPNGCDVFLPISKIDFHVKTCKYTCIPCPIIREHGKCNSINVSIPKLELHFAKQHPKNLVLNLEEEMVIENIKLTTRFTDIKLIVFEKCFFLYHMKIDIEKKVAFWAVQWVASLEQNRSMMYELSIYDKSYINRIEFTVKCESLKKTSLDLFDSGNCVAVPLNVLENFIQDDDLFFKLCLKPVTPRSGRSEEKQNSKRRSKSAQKNLKILASGSDNV